MILWISKNQRRNCIPYHGKPLYDLAVEKQIDGEEIKHKEKTEIIRRVLLSDITEAEIEAVIDDYTYGNRVTFTLWGFQKLYL